MTRHPSGHRSRGRAGPPADPFDDDRIEALLHDEHLFDESLFRPADEPPTDSPESPDDQRRG